MNTDFKGLKFYRVEDNRAFEYVGQDTVSLLPIVFITASGMDGKPPESDRVVFSHHDDFISLDGDSRYDLSSSN